MPLPDVPEIEAVADAAEDAARATRAGGAILRRIVAAGRFVTGLSEKTEEQPTDSAEAAPDGEAPLRPVLMVGPGGVGKTTFGRLIQTGSSLPAEPTGRYRESIRVEEFRSPSATEAEYISPPGQERRRPRDWDALLEALASGHFRGVMIFASYGYHSVAMAGGYKAHPLYAGGKSKFLEDYLRSNREEEIEVARLVGRTLRGAPSQMFLLTCVTKQDLWWKEKAEVDAFYESGGYAAALDAALDGCDHGKIRRELSFCCLAIQNFRDSQRTVLAEHASGYDEVKKAEQLHVLVDRLEELRDWERE